MHKAQAFAGGAAGNWEIVSITPLTGPGLAMAPRLHSGPAEIIEATGPGGWVLKGIASNLRYATRSEVAQLRARQEGLGRAGATCAALIPIRKRQDWWDLAQDERRAIIEERSRHTAIGLEYLPAIARQLYHARDLGEAFDFLTWFEFAAADAAAFDDLLGRLRASEEWAYVEREVDIRLARDSPCPA